MKLFSLVRQAGFGLRYRLKMSRGRRAVMAHLASPTTAPVPMPTFVQLRVTNLCNLRCKMCGQWGDTGIFREGASESSTDGEAERQHVQDLIGLRRQMSIPDYVRLLDELAPHKPVISLFGGEPFLYPEIIALVREVKRRGLTLSVITNGWLLERYARELVELGIDTIAVSVDGPREVHDRIRGRASSFERLAAGVKAVARFRSELSRPFPVQMAILPITELNIEHVGAAIEELSALPLDLINVGLRWFVPRDVGAHYEDVMQEAFGVSGGSWRGFEFSWPGGAEAARSQQMLGLVKQLGRLRTSRVADFMAGRPWISFLPEVAANDVPAYFTDFQQTFGHELCPVAWYFAQVEPDGEVCFCGDFPDYFIGNVKTRPFHEIWRGPRATSFREKLAREPLPVCARCCGSYLYGKWQRPKIADSRNPAPGAPDRTTENSVPTRR
jgi:MoaA/NifB/PqqE/SkfB family radical SAM enzyme